ncbi:MAG TPA: SigE family RNA polymerase sigma factor [Mycobacteriales bacterium]|nr:SigE family RNA polymerase sigma factor [Mycobacteriales bacterium]
MAGDEDRAAQFCAYVSARGTALLRTAYLLTGDTHLAEDLLQAALTKTYLSWGRVRDRSALDGYVRQIMVNTLTSWWRRRWRAERPAAELPDLPATALADAAGVAVERQRLWAHLQALPQRQRAVVVLRYYEDLTEAETARILDCSVGTVKSQAHRALATLRDRLGAEAARDAAVGGQP